MKRKKKSSKFSIFIDVFGKTFFDVYLLLLFLQKLILGFFESPLSRAALDFLKASWMRFLGEVVSQLSRNLTQLARPVSLVILGPHKAS